MKRWLAVFGVSLLVAMAHVLSWAGVAAFPRFGPPPPLPPDATVQRFALWPPGWVWFPVVLALLTGWAARTGLRARWRDRLVLMIACLTAWLVVVHVARSTVTVAISIPLVSPMTPERP